ncbi:MAG: hypothetical protein VYA17_03015 [Pseudomonadota bacterium]|nr:hypothetical protein [Pseudomonadota bacterium]
MRFTLSSDPPESELDKAATRALEIVDRALLDGKTEDIPDETVQRLLTAGTRLFANKVEMEDRFFSPYTGPEAVTATDVVMTCSDMLRAVNLSTFDLAMWFQRPRSGDDI